MMEKFEKKFLESLNNPNESVDLPALNDYCKKLSNEDKLKSSNSTLRQEFSCALIQHVSKSTDGLFIQAAVSILRYMSRDKEIVSKYMNNQVFIKKLCSFGGHSLDKSESHPILSISEKAEVDSCRCLCNIIFLTKDSEKLLENTNFAKSIVNQVKNHNSRSIDQNTITLRLLFLIAALSSKGREKLVEEYDVRKVLLDFLKDLICSSGDSSLIRSSHVLSLDSTNMCNEVLKVIFYLNMDLRRKSVFSQEELDELDVLLELCAALLLSTTKDASLTEALHCNAGNAMYSVPPQCFHVEKLIRTSQTSSSADNTGQGSSDNVDLEPVKTLLNIMRSRVMNDLVVCDVLHPLFALFSQLCRLSREIRIFMKQEIIPPRKDFKSRPEEGNELGNKLIKLFTHNNTDLKHGAADFIFVLCKEKVDRFVKYTGYGNAAGLLALRGLLAGGQGETVYSDTDSDSDTEEYKEVCDEVNPVTGHIPPVRPNPMEGMTDEQKEYLAVQLANQFSKLSGDSPIQPMCVGEDGKLVPFQQKVHETELKEENSSDDE